MWLIFYLFMYYKFNNIKLVKNYIYLKYFLTDKT